MPRKTATNCSLLWAKPGLRVGLWTFGLLHFFLSTVCEWLRHPLRWSPQPKPRDRSLGGAQTADFI